MTRSGGLLATLLLFAAACSDTATVPPVATTQPALATTSTTNAATAPTCPEFGPAEVVGTVANPALTEISGAVAGRANPDALWVHNDSGDAARLFAISRTGADLGEFVLAGVDLLDAEDIAAGPGPDPGVDYLYLADIGDNLDTRAGVAVYRVPEPAVTASGVVVLKGAERIRLFYPGAPRNAEVFLVDPTDGALYVVAKDTGEVFRADGTAQETTMELVASIDLPADGLATGGDISADGSLVAVRTYFSVSLWQRAPGDSLAEALAGERCVGSIGLERQGEALAFAADGSGYYTVSEGSGPALYLVKGR